MKKLAVMTLSLILLSLMASAQKATTRETTPTLAGKKLVMIIAQSQFRDEEILKPRAILEEAGAQVMVASSRKGTCTGMLGAKVKAEQTLEEIDVRNYDAVVFVGGAGASEYWDNERAHQLARDAVKQGKVLGAICIAPVTLARAGVLKGKRATVFGSQRAPLERAGARCTGKEVQVDGKIITADGPAAAEKFGQALVQALKEAKKTSAHGDKR